MTDIEPQGPRGEMLDGDYPKPPQEDIGTSTDHLDDEIEVDDLDVGDLDDLLAGIDPHTFEEVQ